MKFALIGTGNMGRALLNGFISGGVLEPSDIYVNDVIEDSAKDCAEKFGVNFVGAQEAVDNADYVLFAVKPQQFDECVSKLSHLISDNTVIISIAAAVNVERIAEKAGGKHKIIRVMPNTPAQVGAGVSAVVCKGLSKEEEEFAVKLFETCGTVIPCDEKTLDAIGCVSGTGPAYVMLFIEAMADGAVKLGIKRDDALKIAAATVFGSAKLQMETGMNPAIIKDMVCSPAGTTIAGVAALEEYGLRNAVIKAVEAADQRTKEMSGNK